MPTFVFMLTPYAEEDEIEKVRSELQVLFPQHEFLTNLEGLEDIENDIAVFSEPSHGNGHVESAIWPDEAEIDRVKAAFFALLRS
ncbi:MAG: hypothetical protein CFE29_09920 [Bradyrhizobiaceae bacterium PARB1]|jgi:hypothetical protein|nr:MAG: hypothetical protein CFE29_09920 [Bradyrhizobiaceae bacterium PARB1]